MLNPPLSTVEPPVRRPRQKKTAAPLPSPMPAKPEQETPGASSAIPDQSKIIIARVDVGWGNSVYIRDEGGCLNWEVGVPMICSGEDRWVWNCHADQAPRQFKFLRNDRDLELGDNEVMSGADITGCSPKFPE